MVSNTLGEMRHWSTDLLPQAHRLDYWVGAICEGFLEMTASSPTPDDFNATLDSAACGPVAVSRVRACAADVWRTRQAISRSKSHNYYLIATRDADWSVEQRDSTVWLRPRDMVLVDSEQRYKLHFPVACETVSIQLPPSWLGTWLPDPQSIVARPMDGQVSWGAVLSGFMHQVSPEVAVDAPLPVGVLSDQFGALLALAVGAPRVQRPAKVASDLLHARIIDCIEQRHAQTGLTACMVASDLGISERTLHRHLALGSRTFLQALIASRMSSALRMLLDKRFHQLSVAEVGRRCGFSDASHFSRLCRTHLGKAPLQLRNAP